MKTTIFNHFFVRLILELSVLFLLSTSCAPKTYKALFYDYELVDWDEIRVGDWVYYTHMQYSEIQNLPAPVKRYAIVSGMVGNERVTELFFDYKGQVQSSDFNIRFKKGFRVSDHVSAVDPIYEAAGKSFPLIVSDSKLHGRGSFSARLFGRNLLKNTALNPETVSDLCLLKYMAQMVWYPAAFINSYNVEWNNTAPNAAKCIDCAYLKLNNKFIEGHGKMEFDVETGLPGLFTATISEKTSNDASLKKVCITYHNYYKNGAYLVPSKCVATIETDEHKRISIEMELKESLQISISKLLDNDFMDKVEGERKKMNKHKSKIEHRISKREARKQKRALRRAKRNKL